MMGCGSELLRRRINRQDYDCRNGARNELFYYWLVVRAVPGWMYGGRYLAARVDTLGN